MHNIEYITGKDKEWILNNIDSINTKKQEKRGINLLMFILSNNKTGSFFFKKPEILKILEKSNLGQQDYMGKNGLYYIIRYNDEQELGFRMEDINILLKIFPKQRYKIYQDNTYFLVNRFFSDYKITKDENKNDFILRLGIEEVGIKKKPILIEELNNGTKISNEKLIYEILYTKNKKIVECVYNHIDQINFKHDELIFFLNFNSLEVNNKIAAILSS